jgi:hypothetical protein
MILTSEVSSVGNRAVNKEQSVLFFFFFFQLPYKYNSSYFLNYILFKNIFK